MVASEDWRLLVTNFEGLKLESYQDLAGVWTIGYGHTLGVKPKQKITEERAVQLLYKDVERFASAVNRRVTVPLTQYQFDALVSFTFNLGYGNFTNEKCTLLRKINKGEYVKAAPHFMDWVYANGKNCNFSSSNCYGIVKRRKAEQLMFNGSDWKQYGRFV